MEAYNNPVVVLEKERVPEPENHEDDVDYVAKLFMEDIMSCNLIDCSIIDLPNVEESEPEEPEEPKHRFRSPDCPRGFTFLPSWYEVYYDLKEDNPERALHYLEGLIDFGVLGVEPPRTSPEDRLVYSLLDGPMNVIDKKYLEYRHKKDKAKWKKGCRDSERRKERYEIY